jgi:hypothetical protein
MTRPFFRGAASHANELSSTPECRSRGRILGAARDLDRSLIGFDLQEK